METLNNEIIIKPVRVKKLGNYKYPDGCKAYYKANNYMNEYHKKIRLKYREQFVILKHLTRI